jgi:hypothetical protein
MMVKAYTAFGILILALTGYGEFRGWSFASINQLRNVPNSVRDNPGSYRSIYGGYHHYTGGK